MLPLFFRKLIREIRVEKTISIAVIAACFVALSACTPYVSWKEEVKLNDGRIIVVEQKKRVEGLIAREAWLTISLSEFSSTPIVWHEYLIPIVVNVDNAKLYVIGSAPTGLETNKYGCPKPPYVPFV